MRWSVVLGVACIVFACAVFACAGASSEMASPDAEDAVAIPGGKFDEAGLSPCVVSAVVAHLNGPSLSVDSLRANGVHTRAATNIVNHRAGVDGTLHTEDDLFFASIVEVDDVPWVGPVAMQQLAAMVGSDCTTPDAADAAVIFSPQPWNESHLAKAVELIDGATRSIDVAMYSFRDAQILDALERAVERGVATRMIFESARDHRRDPDGTMSARLEERGIDVRYINKIMHHKFVIVDGPHDGVTTDGILMSGSGNWSNSAGTRFDENALIIPGHAELLLRFQREYEHLWTNSRPFEFLDLPFQEAHIISDALIDAADGADADAFFTSANFQIRHSATYGPTFSVLRGENEIADQLVELINGAESSILIASGHLRSRPVAEALLAKAGDPNIEIRIYLDGQEFLSGYSHDRQVEEREECLANAGSSESRIADCLDRGFLYSRQMALAGIDLRFKYYSYRWHYSYAPQMHHKYLVIDRSVLVTGSYNLSDNAEHNTMENVIVLRGATHQAIVARFVSNFEAMWNTRRDTEYDNLLGQVASGDTFPIIFDAMALTWEQVDHLKRQMRTACRQIDSEEFRRNPQSHYSCTP